MALVTLIVGVVLYLINQFIPMQAQVKKLLNAAVVIVLAIWWVLFLLHWAGISTGGL
jgi:hypothetical protein